MAASLLALDDLISAVDSTSSQQNESSFSKSDSLQRTMAAVANMSRIVATPTMKSSILFMCDIQTKFVES